MPDCLYIRFDPDHIECTGGYSDWFIVCTTNPIWPYFIMWLTWVSRCLVPAYTHKIKPLFSWLRKWSVIQFMKMMRQLSVWQCESLGGPKSIITFQVIISFAIATNWFLFDLCFIPLNVCRLRESFFWTSPNTFRSGRPLLYTPQSLQTVHDETVLRNYICACPNIVSSHRIRPMTPVWRLTVRNALIQNFITHSSLSSVANRISVGEISPRVFRMVLF